ncbi:MAG TPA: SDR family oxidoreductase [Xanthobacteraceae bacterium]|nr:SDR family oxidoreductase [Xanthobacteraceae bacterium]
MDLGISGRTAIVCASSKGLGRACALALAQEGVNVVINARTAADVSRTAEEIRDLTGVSVTEVVADITTPAGRAALLTAAPTPDILVNNAGGPGPGDFRDWDEAVWQDAINANMITPILLIKATIDGMIARRFGRIVNITSRSVKTPLPALGLSNGARAGLTGFVAGLSRQVAAHNVVINNLLPGPFETDRIRTSAAREAGKSGLSLDQIMAKRAAEIPVGRLGQPDEFGKACAFLCSSHAEFIIGQNLLLDGGGFASTI